MFLDCKHGFCLECLVQQVTTGRTNVAECPQCRQHSPDLAMLRERLDQAKRTRRLPPLREGVRLEDMTHDVNTLRRVIFPNTADLTDEEVLDMYTNTQVEVGSVGPVVNVDEDDDDDDEVTIVRS